MALILAYNIPHRDCGQFSTGGAADDNAYRVWVDQLAGALADRAAIVILEPDALAHTLAGCAAQATGRDDLLRYAVDKFTANPDTMVSIDAGNSAWIKNPADMVEPLGQAGVANADGFALNVSNFQPTKTTVAYGRKISQALNGAHLVIDTSRNGNGPRLDAGGTTVWCNPGGQARGEAPTTDTGDPLADAWIKRPGESDGSCGPSQPPAGAWWAEYAWCLADNARCRLNFQPGPGTSPAPGGG